MEPVKPVNEINYLKELNELRAEIIKVRNEKNKDLQNKLKIQQQEFIPSMPVTLKGNIDIVKKKTGAIFTIYILQDGRLAAKDSAGSIIIYNKINFEPEITITEKLGDKDYIMYLTQLNNGALVSLLSNGYIYIYNLSDYKKQQEIKAHNERVHKLRVLDNYDGHFLTCSEDSTIKLFSKGNKNIYYEVKDFFKVKDKMSIFNLLRTREGEIVYLGYDSENSYINFYDIILREIIVSLKTKQKLYNGLTDNLYKLNDTHLLVGADNAILILDVNQHQQIKEIESRNSSFVTCFLKLDEKSLLSVDYMGNIKQWRIENDNLILVKEKKKAHAVQIRMIRKNQEGLVITCSDDKSIKIWK